MTLAMIAVFGLQALFMSMRITHFVHGGSQVKPFHRVCATQLVVPETISWRSRPNAAVLTCTLQSRQSLSLTMSVKHDKDP